MVTPRDSRCKLLPVQGAPVVQYLPQLRQLRVPEVAESLPSSIQLPKSCLPQHAQSAWLLMLALSARIRGPRATAAMDVKLPIDCAVARSSVPSSSDWLGCGEIDGYANWQPRTSRSDSAEHLQKMIGPESVLALVFWNLEVPGGHGL